ncbi:hypothetical protein CB0940_11232 [Cercospora beticola]|uniref:Zn(2)-C6 fungal-type domain-containing protein n=1 Tax=Cercospora beticola TaxID=122368 RepID=A0A2G5HD50_CERBT|nr:hypothetical protein CB0940_11232 [Cercospora beticola]PIA90449.1 hypothetical protein CB0940_11232 [Cercospora beticola]WPB08064.1 hypothetical protein RHO25_012728 [Cercospora beticola]
MEDPPLAQLFGSHFFDYGLPGALADHPFPVLVDENGWPVNMTQLDCFDDAFWPHHEMILDTTNHTDVAKSPAQQSHRTGTEGSDSLSPDDASGHILTPSSTNYSPYMTNLDDPESDVASGSPESERSVAGDFVHVLSPNGPQTESMRQNYAPRSSPRPGPVPSAQTSSLLRHAAIPSQSHRSPGMPSRHWQSFGPSTNTGVDGLNTTAYASFPGAQDFQLYDDSAILANVGDSFDPSFASAPQQQQDEYGSLSFRSHDGALQNFQAQIPSHDQSLADMQYVRNAVAYPQQGQPLYPATSTAALQFDTSSQYLRSIENTEHVTHDSLTTPQALPVMPKTITHPPQKTTHVAPHTNPTSRGQTSGRSHAQPRSRVQVRPAPASSGGNSPNSSATSSQYESFDLSGSYPYIAAAASSLAQPAATRVSHADKVSKSAGPRGGRKKNSHLPDVSRQRSHAMRKVGACWRCVMQRDPCDAPEGGCCSRCVMRAARGQTYYFGCDRSKLPEFVHEFLPASLLHDHQKQSIETFVSSEVVHWHVDNCIDVYLSSGYGPPLPWKLYEFTPRNLEFLYQLQATQDPQSMRTITKKKYSPPYGLLKIDSVDDRNYEAYLEDLLQPQWLKELGESAYAEENLVDEGMFQCKVLDLMCQLYIGTSDRTLKPLLGDVLRMIIITYIMGHTLTITEETLYPVINNIRHTPRPPANQKHTSPRLANRQLKFFFHLVRNSIYEKVLKWQQHTLHTAGKKQETWLHAFCVTLGFAMVLEEVQRTMMCHAEAKIYRGEATPEDAFNEAQQHCENIDKRFKLLIGLFQCKYRDRKWTDTGSFGNGTPEFNDPVSNTFLLHLRHLVEQRESHLRSREDVQFSLENQCLYTTRLTARFLLPFLNLPPA